MEDTTIKSGIKDKKKWMQHPLLLLFGLYAGPVDGWRRIKQSKISSRRALVGCFYPLLIITSLIRIPSEIWFSQAHLDKAIVSAVILFMTFFIGYYGAVLGCKFIRPKKDSDKMASNFGHVFISMCQSTLIIVFLLWGLLPAMTPLIVFLPVFTIYIIQRGTRILRIGGNDKTTMATISLCVLIIGIPAAIYLIFS